MGFSDKNVIVTGAASGIGRTTAIRFAKAGANVYLMDIAEKGLQETAAMAAEYQTTVHYRACDVSDENAVNAAIEDAYAKLGNIDVLVNVAGVQITKLIVDTSYKDYQKMMDVNVGGTFLTIHAVLNRMKAAGHGAIVNVASELAFVGYSELAVYTATKGAMLSMTRSVALEAIPYGVRVNCVCPGATDTPIFWEGETDPVKRQKMLDQVKVEKPIGRLITTDEVANGILFMASDEASGIVGTSLIIDGAFTAQ